MDRMTEEKVRLLNGLGPEVTVPDWWKAEVPPSPEMWLDWFLKQNYQAQLIITSFHLDVERRFVKVQEAMQS